MGCGGSAFEDVHNGRNDHNRNRGYDRPPNRRQRTPPPRQPSPRPRRHTPPYRQPSPSRQLSPPRQRNDQGDTLNYSHNKSTGLFEVNLDFRIRSYSRPAVHDPSQDGHLYTDRDFPLNVAIEEYRDKQLQWMRPDEFCGNPVLFADGTTRFDIGQGSAGTCWFLSMVANLAENEDFIQKVIPLDGWNPRSGVIKCNFYNFGHWETIYTDDCLPVIYGDKPWGAKSASDPNEMWVSMVEKGFAKLHGSYNSIYGGQASDAYLAMTGGVAEAVDLEDARLDPVKLFNRVKNALQTGSLVACTVPDKYDDYAGLIGGHAYSLNGTGVVGTRNGEVRLVRVRNPWGHHEWTGPWSDGSYEWESVIKNTVENPNVDDGEFWICLDDFMTYFSQTTLCSLTPDFDADGRSDSLNYIACIFGAWVGDKAAGYENRLENPRYIFSIPREGTTSSGHVPVVIQIIQRTKHRKSDRISIRCDLFKIIGNGKGVTRKPSYNMEILGKNTNVYSAEIQVSSRHLVEPGEYVLIPSSLSEGQEKEFLIRIFTPSPLANIREMESDVILRSCEEEKYLEYHNSTYQLTHTESWFGEWIVGVNAGGQVSNRETFASNPQYVFRVTGREHPVVFHVMQDPDNKYAIGIRVFPLRDRPPVKIDYLYHYYDDCFKSTTREISNFIISHDVQAKYVLPPGEYLVLIHMDDHRQGTSYSLLVRSDTKLDFRGFQTGN